MEPLRPGDQVINTYLDTDDYDRVIHLSPHSSGLVIAVCEHPREQDSEPSVLILILTLFGHLEWWEPSVLLDDRLPWKVTVHRAGS